MADKCCHTCEITKSEHLLSFDYSYEEQEELVLRKGNHMHQKARFIGVKRANESTQANLFKIGKQYGINYLAG